MTKLLVVHDAEIDDMCALLNYGPIDLELMCSDIHKIEGPSWIGKSNLYRELFKRELSSVPLIKTDGKGRETNAEDVKRFISLILNFFNQTKDSRITIILTGQCAPIFGILTSLLKLNLISVDNFEIIWINGRHNGLGCGDPLRELSRFKPVIKEFNAYSSLGEGISRFLPEVKSSIKTLGTSPEFAKIIPSQSVIAEYAMKFNYGLLKCIPKKIRNLQKNLKESELGLVADRIENKLLKGEDLGLHPKRCQKIANDLNFILSVLMNQEKKDLEMIAFLGPKLEIVRNNLIQFPIHDLAAAMILKDDKSFQFIPAYAQEDNNFIEIDKELSNDSIIEVLHYLSSDPENVVKLMETMILKSLNL